MFYFDYINGKKVLKSDLIKGMTCFFTTRESVICDKSLQTEQSQAFKNQNQALNNILETISENKKIICNYLKIEEKNLLSPDQTHSANIDVAIETKHDYLETDALILTDKNLGIFLNFADCTPVVIYDNEQNFGAIAHAGWRGTAQKIAPLTVEKMVKELGSKPENITAVIGPAIGFCCYNVGDEVYQKLFQTVENFDGMSEIRDSKIYVDLKSVNKRQLEEIGVKKIDICPYCTICNNEDFFSYRKENATTLRHSAVIKLN